MADAIHILLEGAGEIPAIRRLDVPEYPRESIYICSGSETFSDAALGVSASLAV